MLVNQSNVFDVRMPLGSYAAWTLSLFQADNISPFPTTGHTLEYVVYTLPFGQGGTEVVRLRSDVPGSPTPSGGGLVSLINTTTQGGALIALYPPATTPLAAQTYYHALWMDYGDPINNVNLFWGQLMLDPAVQP